MKDLGFDFREILRRKYVERSKRNPAYSLRAYARDIGLSPSRLSEVMHANQRLSRRSAHRVANNLSLDLKEKKFFCALVDSEDSRSHALRSEAVANINALKEELNGHLLKEDTFDLIADWYHSALVAYFSMADRCRDISSIAKFFNLSKEKVQTALLRLQRLGIISKRKGSLEVSTAFFQTTNDFPSQAIRNFHAQILDLAKESQDLQPLDERCHEGLVFSIDKKDVAEAKVVVRSFIKEFRARFGSSQHEDAVYCLSAQLFQLGGDSNVK